MDEPTLARAAMEAAGYRRHGLQARPPYTGATLYQRRMDSITLSVLEWPPLPHLRAAHRYEMDVYDDGEYGALLAKLYSYSPEVFAARLPELEARAIAVVRAVREP